MLPEGNTNKMDKPVVNPAAAIAELQRTKFKITVEPVAYLFISANIIQVYCYLSLINWIFCNRFLICFQLIVTQNLYLLKICQVNFNFSSTFCDPSAPNRTENPFLTTTLQVINQLISVIVFL